MDNIENEEIRADDYDSLIEINNNFLKKIKFIRDDFEYYVNNKENLFNNENSILNTPIKELMNNDNLSNEFLKSLNELKNNNILNTPLNELMNKEGQEKLRELKELMNKESQEKLRELKELMNKESQEKLRELKELMNKESQEKLRELKELMNKESQEKLIELNKKQNYFFNRFFNK